MHQLGAYFRKKNLYLARDYEFRCRKELPDLFITYDWRMDLTELQQAIWSGLDYVAVLINEREPDLIVEPLIGDGIGIWVDFMFINQNARDIRSELDVLPQLMASCAGHFVLSDTALTRAWCCYELALFNQRVAERKDKGLLSMIAPTLLHYKLWDGVESTELQDKAHIEERIIKDYPGGFLGFEYIMLQANLAGELAVQNSATTQIETAIEEHRNAAEKWLTRFDWKAADGLTRASNFDSLENFVARTKAYQPKEGEDLADFFSVAEKSAIAERVITCSVIWASSHQALVFATARSKKCEIGLVFLLGRSGVWRIRDIRKFAMIGEQAEMRCELITAVGERGGTNLPAAVVKVTTDRDGRGYPTEKGTFLTIERGRLITTDLG
jgi:hypothetical protein